MSPKITNPVLSERLRISLLLIILSFGVTTVHSQPDSNPTPLLYEDFSKFPSTGYSTRLTTFPDTYTDTPGWMGMRVERATSSSDGTDACGVIVGRTGDGVLFTPTVTTTSGDITIVLDIKSYSVKGNYVLVFACDPETGAQLTNPDNDNRFYVDDEDFTTTDSRLLLHLHYPRPCRLLISPDKAAYLHAVTVYDGIYEVNDIATAISQAKTRTEKIPPTTYNLQGQPSKNRHGLYIKNGKVYVAE